MDNRNTVIAIALSLAILLGWETFFAPKAPPPSEAPVTAPAAPPATPGTADVAAPVAAPAGAPTAADTAAPAVAEKRVRVMTREAHGSVSLTGGRFDDITLVSYRETLDPKSPEIVLLSPANTPKPYHAEWGWISADSSVALPGPGTTWTQTSPEAVLTETAPLVLTWDNGQGLVFTRTVRADKEYLFTVEQTVRNTGDKAVTLYPYALVARLDMHQSKDLGFMHEGPLGVFDRTLKEISYKDLKKKGLETIESSGGWIGFTDKYWLAAVSFDPAMKITGSYKYNDAGGRDRFQTDLRGEPVTAQPGETQAVTGYLFAGAKELQLLDEYSTNPGIPRFDLAIDFGWYYFLTKPFFLALRWLHGVLGNFGLAIIALSTLIRLLMFPIANKQFKTMNAMKRLQPEMKRLQEKYAGGDRTKMNQELMELYKREKANPLAGCLPIIIQIPVFYALYKVLSVTIEMRHAPFYGWIHDLSAKDPTTVLNLFGLLPFTPPDILSIVSIGAWPLIMGVTMYLQQKLSPQPADPMQAKIMMLMPIVITFVLAPYAAGLVIYWAWSNTLGILQQWILLKRTEAAEAKTAT
ncbi:MAG: membrane protein insertase YidC [Rhodospirillaceae bacterium]|nr:membrane protein insertase YidC [Rhodospirillaceae bacterium]